MIGAQGDHRARVHQLLDGRELANRHRGAWRERRDNAGASQSDGVALRRAQQVIRGHGVQLRGKPRSPGAVELVGVDARDQLRFHRCLQDASRLRHGEVAAVAEHVAEPRASDVGVVAPLADLFCVRAQACPPVRRQGMRGEKCDLDVREVFALAEAREQARGLELTFPREVVARLRLDRRLADPGSAAANYLPGDRLRPGPIVDHGTKRLRGS